MISTEAFPNNITLKLIKQAVTNYNSKCEYYRPGSENVPIHTDTCYSMSTNSSIIV